MFSQWLFLAYKLLNLKLKLICSFVDNNYSPVCTIGRNGRSGDVSRNIQAIELSLVTEGAELCLLNNGGIPLAPSKVNLKVKSKSFRIEVENIDNRQQHMDNRK
ncbi:MAG: hypothetical protein HWN68_04865 [Desulfobacterales bacterium]|nr:hypothetical protein [Desulfobacterales bacterium]